MTDLTGERYVFISDLHLGDQNSYQPTQPNSFPYGWTNRHTAELATFLDDLDSFPETKGANAVMIVGDLVDTWVCPAQLPPPSFASVLGADHNKQVIQALNGIAQKSHLMYLPGNHDMLIDPTILSDYIKGIDIVGDTTGKKEFYNGSLVAEHGHQYCLFNAVDNWSRQTVDGHLPLGYFMARLAAEGAFEKDDQVSYLELLWTFIKDFKVETDFAWQIMNALESYESKTVGSRHTTVYQTDHIDGFAATIDFNLVQKIYGAIYDQWDKQSQSGIPATIAAVADAGALRPAADLKYLIPGELCGSVKVVIFGHTHKYEIRTGLIAGDDLESMNHQGKVIYGNCGSWIDQKPCTFIVTDKTVVREGLRISVRGYQFELIDGVGRITLQDEAFVVVGM